MSSACPTRDDLAAYALGKFPRERCEEIDMHLEQCTACQAELETCGNMDDTFLSRLREPESSDEFLDEAECAEVMARVAAIGREPSFATLEAAAKVSGPAELGSIGVYRLLAKLGEGGMGAVYKALHTKLERVVALKILPASRLEDERAVTRFQREMKAVGQLAHPNIVMAHDAGEADDTHFLVMEYVDGLDLSKLVARLGPLPVADACELVHQAALGLQCAHEHGLVHRDVKPANLMLAVAESKIKILDLGLALFKEQPVPAGETTASGQAMGTADYMAPEQTFDSHTVDIRADIYSLGCTLYKLLTGHAPFSGPEYTNQMAKMMAHVQEPAPSITERRPDLPAELAALIERMMAKRPEGRFDLPGDVAFALEPFTADSDLAKLAAEASKPSQPTDASDSSPGSTDPFPSSALVGTKPSHASPLSLRERVGVRAKPPLPPGEGRGDGCLARTSPPRRRPPRWAVAAAMAPLFLAALGTVIWINRTRLEVPDGSEVRIGQDGSVEVTTPDAKPAAGRKQPSAPEVGPPVKAGAVPIKAEPLQFGPPIPRPEPVPIRLQRDPNGLGIEPGEPISSMALVQQPAKIEGLRSWSLETVGHRGTIHGVAFHPDGHRLAVGGYDGTIRVWDTADGRLTQAIIGNIGRVGSLCWSPDGRVLAAISDGELRLLDAQAACPLKPLPGPKRVHTLGWSPDGRWLAGAANSSEGQIYVWDLRSGKPPMVLRGHEKSVLALAWSPDGKTLASIALDDTLRIWEPLSGRLGHAITLPPDSVSTLGIEIGWSPDGRYVGATLKGQKQFETWVWDADGGEVASRLPGAGGHDHFYLKWSPGTGLVATGSYHGPPAVKVWDLEADRVAWEASDRSGGRGLAFSPDASKLAFGTYWGDVCLRDARSGEKIWSLPGHGGSSGAAFSTLSPDGQRLASFHNGVRCAVRLWDPTSGKLLREFPTKSEPMTASWSPDGTMLAVGEIDQCFTLWQTDPVEPLRRLPVVPGGGVGPPAWSPDGKRIATVSNQRQTQVWDVASGEPLWTVPGTAIAPAFSPDGKTLAVADDRQVKCYDAVTGEPGKTFSANDQPIYRLAWSTDGNLLAAAEAGLQLFVWDVASGELRDSPKLPSAYGGHPGLLRWLDDGRRLIAGGMMIASIYDLESGKVTRTMAGRFGFGQPSACARLVAMSGLNLTDIHATSDGSLLRTILSLREGQHAVISPDGHYRGSPGIEKELVYVALTDAGEQLTLTPEEFEKQYGWKNDPSQVRLGFEPAGDTPDEPTGGEAEGESYRPPVVEPEQVRFFEQQDLYKSLTEIVDDSRSDFMQRLLYTEIAATMQREHVGSWRLGPGMTRDGQACEFSVKNTQWFARKLPEDEARELGLSGSQWGRTIDVMWKPPVEPIMAIEAAEVHVETDAEGNAVLVGTIRCKVDAPRRVDYLSLVLSSPSAEEGENVTREVYQYVRPERLPGDTFQVNIPLGHGKDVPTAGRFYFQAFLFEPKASFYRISNELMWTGESSEADAEEPAAVE